MKHIDVIYPTRKNQIREEADPVEYQRTRKPDASARKIIFPSALTPDDVSR